MKTLAIILTIAVIVFLGHSWRNELWRYRWYRRHRGGSWYKYRLTGELPGTTGTYWSQFKHEPHRYYELVKQENYGKDSSEEERQAQMIVNRKEATAILILVLASFGLHAQSRSTHPKIDTIKTIMLISDTNDFAVSTQGYSVREYHTANPDCINCKGYLCLYQESGPQ